MHLEMKGEKYKNPHSNQQKINAIRLLSATGQLLSRMNDK